ncbi:MAG: ROK family protein, partial [Bacteroidetes bacterium]|nr:ROK family protein [Bacteroidota bacterium]
PFSERLMPRDIAEIAKGIAAGDQLAAQETYKKFGEALGSSISNILTLIDGIVVLGGGITAAWELFSPTMFEEINRKYLHFTGAPNDRLSFKVFNLEDPGQIETFAHGKIENLSIPGTTRTIPFDSMPRTGVGISKIGASHAIAMGAYTFALQQLDNQ